MNTQIGEKLAWELNIFTNLEEKQKFLLILGALTARLISLQKAAEIMEIETDLFLQILTLIGVDFSYLSNEDIEIEKNW